MQRAARIFADWFINTYPDSTRSVVVFAGTGNNGGDGLVVAQMLDQAQYPVKVVVCDFATSHSLDFEAQLATIAAYATVKPVMYRSAAALMAASVDLLPPNALIIDALFGTGLNRPLVEDWAQVIDWMNSSQHEIVSIDIPSGLLCDARTPGDAIIRAAKTFTFETPKLAFFFAENAHYLGEWVIGSIGLHPEYVLITDTPFHYNTPDLVKFLWKPRSKFSHKGSYGHALLIAGSWGKMGAAVLAGRACLRAGAGLLTVHSPRCGQMVLQTTIPEAMVSADKRAKYWTDAPVLEHFAAIGIGPGIGQEPQTAAALKQLLPEVKTPLVLDADALNILAAHQDWLAFLPENTIITPHPKEFERLFGKSDSSFERFQLQRMKAQEYKIYIILKGANTSIVAPDGRAWFNSTGNPGMATGGTGDVLTGILTGLLAQGYGSKETCLLGVYLHGLAGDLAAAAMSQEALIAGNLIGYLGAAWLEVEN